MNAMHGKPTARQADGGAKVRGRKKQRPPGNGADRAWNIAQRKIRGTSFHLPGEKRAHVRLVFRCEIIWRTS